MVGQVAFFASVSNPVAGIWLGSSCGLLTITFAYRCCCLAHKPFKGTPKASLRQEPPVVGKITEPSSPPLRFKNIQEADLALSRGESLTLEEFLSIISKADSSFLKTEEGDGFSILWKIICKFSHTSGGGIWERRTHMWPTDLKPVICAVIKEALKKQNENSLRMIRTFSDFCSAQAFFLFDDEVIVKECIERMIDEKSSQLKDVREFDNFLLCCFMYANSQDDAKIAITVLTRCQVGKVDLSGMRFGIDEGYQRFEDWEALIPFFINPSFSLAQNLEKFVQLLRLQSKESTPPLERNIFWKHILTQIENSKDSMTSAERKQILEALILLDSAQRAKFRHNEKRKEDIGLILNRCFPLVGPLDSYLYFMLNKFREWFFNSHLEESFFEKHIEDFFANHPAKLVEALEKGYKLSSFPCQNLKMKDSSGNTALHHLMNSPKRRIDVLVAHFPILQELLGMQNENGDHCLHIYVRESLKTATVDPSQYLEDIRKKLYFKDVAKWQTYCEIQNKAGESLNSLVAAKAAPSTASTGEPTASKQETKVA